MNDEDASRQAAKTNARYLRAEDVGEAVEFLAMDVSFISATLVLPAVTSSVQQSAISTQQGHTLEAVVLVKPQFEAGREHVGKGGIVRDAAAQQAAVERVRAAMAELGFAELEAIESPILGAEGNREFLLHGRLNW